MHFPQEYTSLLELLESELVFEADHLNNAKKVAEYVCIHNQDSHDFMNKEIFERLLWRRWKSTTIFWGSLGDTGLKVIEKIVWDEE